MMRRWVPHSAGLHQFISSLPRHLKVTVTRLAGAVTPMLTLVSSDSFPLITVLSSNIVFIGKGRGSSTTTAGANDVSPQFLDSAC